MKRIAITAIAFASVGVAAVSSPAMASDLPMPAPVRMLPAKAPGMLPFNWGGWYAGLNLGGGFGDVGGVIFGGQVGYNWQVNQIVFGIETDLQISGQDDNSPFFVGGARLNDTQGLDWFGTFRGRVGYTIADRWLPYFTVGLAYGTRTNDGSASGTRTGVYSADNTSVGWAIGFGVDYAINPRWSARLEYLHISLDGYTPVYPLGGGALAVAYGNLDNDIVRGAINYRFMPW